MFMMGQGIEITVEINTPKGGILEKTGFEPLNNHKSDNGTSSGTSDDAEKKKSCKSKTYRTSLRRERLSNLCFQEIS